jgi:hypothetical protein
MSTPMHIFHVLEKELNLMAKNQKKHLTATKELRKIPETLARQLLSLDSGLGPSQPCIRCRINVVGLVFKCNSSSDCYCRRFYISSEFILRADLLRSILPSSPHR